MGFVISIPATATLNCGRGTEVVEMLEDQPDLEVIIVPIGGVAGQLARVSRPRKSTLKSG